LRLAIFFPKDGGLTGLARPAAGCDSTRWRAKSRTSNRRAGGGGDVGASTRWAAWRRGRPPRARQPQPAGGWRPWWAAWRWWLRPASGRAGVAAGARVGVAAGSKAENKNPEIRDSSPPSSIGLARDF
jgi:hypothetical protein